MKRLLLITFVAIFAFISLANINNSPKTADWTKSTSVAQVLSELGAKTPTHWVDNMTEEMANTGYEIVTQGFTQKKKGLFTAQQSKHFVCTDCHNIQKEDPNLQFSDPEARLGYAIDHKLPFLQGTSLYGVVNRTAWYNGDYEKKYGDLVEPARNNLKEAIQLCAVECSQGRALENWEMKAVLAYLWNIDIKLGDLALSEEDWATLQAAKGEEKSYEETAKWLQSLYYQASPATFVEAYPSKVESDKLKGNSERGQAIYELSCLHCHRADKGITEFTLDLSSLTFNMLERHLEKYNHYSLYQIARYGTKPMMGYKPYMPQYTLERMSHQQIADLKAFIEKNSN